MADSTTTNYGWAYPTVNADADTWGTTLNNAIIAIDAQMHTVSLAAQPVNVKLTSLAGLAGTSGTIPYFTAANTFGQMSIGSGLTLASNMISANVQSVAGRTGAVTLGKADIADAGTGIGTDIVISSSAPSGTPTKPTLWIQV